MWKGVFLMKNRGNYSHIEVVQVVRSWILCRVDASWVLRCLLAAIIQCVCRRDGTVYEPEKLCEGQTFLLSRAPGKWGRKELLCVLCGAGGGVILISFKLYSTNFPGKDALLQWRNPFETGQESTSSGTSYTVPVLWLSFAGHIQTRTRKCSAL